MNILTGYITLRELSNFSFQSFNCFFGISHTLFLLIVTPISLYLKTKGGISVIEIALFEAVWWQVIMKTVEIYRKGDYLIRGEKTIQLLISNWDNG